MKANFIFLIFNLICIDFCTAQVAGTDFLMLFPSYAQKVDNCLMLRLHGMIYHFDSDQVSLEPIEGSQPQFTSSSLVSKIFQYLPFRNETMGANITLARSVRFISDKPIAGPHYLHVRVLDSKNVTPVSNWTDIGSLHVTGSSLNDGLNISVTTDVNGYFDVQIPVSIDQQKDQTLLLDHEMIFQDVKGAANLFWVAVSAPIVQFPSFQLETKSPMIIVDDTQIHVISDIDDTLKISGINRGVLKIVEDAFLNQYRPVPDMPQFFRTMAQNASTAQPPKQISFSYLSAAPWPLTPAYVNEFFVPSGFPWASFTAKPQFALQSTVDHAPPNITTRNAIAFTDIPATDNTSFFEIPKILPDNVKPPSTYIFKISALSTMLPGPTWKRLVLLGDSTESDFEVYQTVASKLGFYNVLNDPFVQNGSVQCIFIRFVGPGEGWRGEAHYVDETKEDFDAFVARMKLLYANMTGWEEHVRLFTNGTELINTNVLNGECHSDGSRDIWN